MTLVRHGGMVLGTKGGFVSLTKSLDDRSPSDFSKPLPNTENTSNSIAFWGLNNDLPQKMWQDIDTVGILSAGIDAKARIAVGKGPIPVIIDNVDSEGKEEFKYINDSEIYDWLEENNSFENSFSIAKDAFATGNPFAQILLDSNRKIIGWKRQDASMCRFTTKDEKTLRSEYVLMSSDWKRYSLYEKNEKHMSRVKLLDKDYPYYDFINRKDNDFTYMLSLQYPLFGSQYYAPSPWYAAKKYVDIAKGIPEMKSKMFENQMSIKYVVDIHPSHWERIRPGYEDLSSDEKIKVQDEFYDSVDDYLSGNENAYKSIFSTQYFDPIAQQFVATIKITTLDDKVKDGKLLPDAASANSEILFALMMNPALMGLDIPGGGAVRTAGSGSNIRESYLVQVMMLEMERRLMSKVFNLAKKVNGWQDKIGKGKPIALRYPNQILTTLNTGANSAPTA